MSPILAIHPCIDSLMYAPVYLALISLAGRKESNFHVREDNVVVIDAKAGTLDFTVELHTPTEGDENAVRRLSGGVDSSVVRIAVCDALTVVDENYKILRGEGGTLGVGDLLIEGVVIDRIPLCVLFRSLGRSSGRDAATIARDEKLRALVEEIDSRRISFSGELATHSSGLRIDYWSPGRTSSLLSKVFLGAEQPLSPAPGRQTSDIWESCANQLDSLKQRNVDVVVTHASWLIKKFQEMNSNSAIKNIKVATRKVFPSISFPFTAIATSKESRDRDKNGVLKAFRQSLEVSMGLLHQHPNNAQVLLTTYAKFFRNYGIREQILFDGLITRAIYEYLIDGCFSDGLCVSAMAWLQALQWKSKERTGMEMEYLWKALQKTLSGEDAKPFARNYDEILSSWSNPLLNLAR